MKFRHEYKHEISQFDFLVLQSRLGAVLQRDNNGVLGKYKIRSLYFDDLYDTALREKIDGANCREKFRIRCYDDNFQFIRLEKKSKINGLCNKVSDMISASEVSRIINGDFEFLESSDRPLLQELYFKMKNGGLYPKTLVDYTREAFVYPAGNVRVTLDYNICSGLSSNDFLNPDCVTVSAGEPVIILEVKWDEFLPEFVRDLVQVGASRSAAFSKYAAARIYG